MEQNILLTRSEKSSLGYALFHLKEMRGCIFRHFIRAPSSGDFLFCTQNPEDIFVFVVLYVYTVLSVLLFLYTSFKCNFLFWKSNIWDSEKVNNAQFIKEIFMTK